MSVCPDSRCDGGKACMTNHMHIHMVTCVLCIPYMSVQTHGVMEARPA